MARKQPLGRGLSALFNPLTKAYNPSDPYAQYPDKPKVRQPPPVPESGLYRCPSCGSVLVPGPRVSSFHRLAWSGKCSLCYNPMVGSKNV